MVVQITPPPLSSQSLADLFCTIILLCRATNADGQAIWAYMCIKPSMAKAFKDARDSGCFNLEDYGTILEIGNGEDAPADVKHRMEREYGVNHHFEDQLMHAIEKLAHQGA